MKSDGHSPRLVAFWIVVAIAAFYSAFVLPFYFPLHEPVFSAAYNAGENTRIAAIAVAAISIFVLAAFASGWAPIGKGRLSSNANAAPPQLSATFLWWGIALIVVCTAALGYLILHHGAYYAEEGFFVTQLRAGLVFHRVPYRDFDFPYGPALYFWPLLFIRLLAPLGISMPTAYLLSLIVMESAGVALIFYTVNALPMRYPLKAAAFTLITFCAFDTLLGLNYAILRCIAPFAAVVLLTRQTSLLRAMAVACLGEGLLLTISPELGIAFGAAAVFYGVYRKFITNSTWLAVSLAAILGALIFAACIGRDYFASLSQYAHGRDNLILEPQPFVLVLIVAVAALAPFAVADAWKRRTDAVDSNVAMLIALYIAMLGMLPVALAQCDPVHAFVNGIGAYLLSFVAIRRASLQRQRIWVVVVALTFMATQFQQFHAWRHEIVRAITNTPEPYDDPDVTAISAAIGQNKVTFPWNRLPMQMIDHLTQTGQYLPGYFVGYHGECNATSEVRRIADMRAAKFALVPNNQALVYTEEIDNSGEKLWLRLGYRYKQREPPFYEYAMLMHELTTNWKPVGTFGMYTLYQKVR